MTEQLLRDDIAQMLHGCGFDTLSAVQAACIPPALTGRDVFAQAPTGSGKTLAYLLPILQQLQPCPNAHRKPQALILVPSRELAMQIAAVCRQLLAKTEGIRTGVLYGGVPIENQIRSFKRGADIVIGTPGRISDHIRRHTLKLQQCHTFVLDEADEMLSAGFQEIVNSIIQELPPHQTLLFSATYSAALQAFIPSILNDPFTCQIQSEPVLIQQTVQEFCLCQAKQKPSVLRHLLKQTPQQKTIVFCNTRKTCDRISQYLQNSHFQIEVLHGEMDQKDRTRILQAFRSGSLSLLAATDVAARGLDIEQIDQVINYDFPDRPEFYIHRIGRVGRSGRKGTAITLLQEDQSNELTFLQQHGCRQISGQPKKEATQQKRQFTHHQKRR